MQNSGNLLGINKNLRISGDFRGSKLKIFPGKHAHGPPSIFTCIDWRTIIPLPQWLSCLIPSYSLQSYFLWKLRKISNENSATVCENKQEYKRSREFRRSNVFTFLLARNVECKMLFAKEHLTFYISGAKSHLLP